MSQQFGKSISPILEEIHDALWEIDSRELEQPYCYPKEAIPAASKIFMSVCMDKLWENQEKNDTPMEDRMLQAEEMGKDLRSFMIQHLGIDSASFYKGKSDEKA